MFIDNIHEFLVKHKERKVLLHGNLGFLKIGTNTTYRGFARSVRSTLIVAKTVTGRIKRDHISYTYEALNIDIDDIQSLFVYKDCWIIKLRGVIGTGKIIIIQLLD